MPFDQVNFTIPAVETDGVLRRLIEGRVKLASGWCKNSLFDSEGNVCARGALMFCTAGASWDATARAADNLLGRFVPSGFDHDDFGWCPPVVGFNNAPATTHADVLALFDRAIAARRASIASTPA